MFRVVGMVITVLATLFLLFTIAISLTLVLPVGVTVVLVCCAALAVMAVRTFQGDKETTLPQGRPAPERTVEQKKENIGWAQQPGQ